VSQCHESRLPRCLILAVMVLLGVYAMGQQTSAPAVEPGIQDNSFLVEEAYNQNFGVVQHISSFTRFWNSKDWNYSFTQEWPVPGDERHQLSYTLVALHSGGLPGSGIGIGDVFLNYRYQLVGNGDTRVAFSPRLSLILPTGDSSQGRGAGSFGVQTSLPLSVVLNKGNNILDKIEFPGLKFEHGTEDPATSNYLLRRSEKLPRIPCGPSLA
jgi:hypothetical protein